MPQFVKDKPIPKPRTSLTNIKPVLLHPSMIVEGSEGSPESEANNESKPTLPPRSTSLQFPPLPEPITFSAGNQNGLSKINESLLEDPITEINENLSNTPNTQIFNPANTEAFSDFDAKKLDSLSFNGRNNGGENSASGNLYEELKIGDEPISPPADPWGSRLTTIAADSESTASLNSLATTVTATCDSLIKNAKSDGEAVSFFGWTHFLQAKKLTRYWALIRNSRLYFYQDDENQKSPIFEYNLSRCIFAGKIANESDEITLLFRESEKNLKDLSTKKLLKNGGKSSLDRSSSLNGNGELTVVKFIPEDLQKSDHWLVLLSKCFSPKSEAIQNNLNLLDACGNLCFKQGVSGTWHQGWAQIRGKFFYYWVQGSETIQSFDIRKILLIKNNGISAANWCTFIGNSKIGPILIAMDGSSLHLQSTHDQCTDSWYDLLMARLSSPGLTLEDSRLTNDDIPVIVEKCTKFISTYGLKQPGIYRKPGQMSESRALIENFSQDPHAVHLIFKNDESVNAVADVLRSYLRHLTTPLLPIESHQDLMEITNYSDVNLRIEAYRNVINTFPQVHFRTLKLLISHLNEVAAHSDKNKMTADNLSLVFGSTIFGMNQTQKPDLQNSAASKYSFSSTGLHVQVMKDLLTHFYKIFEVSQEEINKLSKFDNVQDIHDQRNKAIANGFLIPVHVFQKDNKCFNVKSESTANDVIDFKVKKEKFASSNHFLDFGLFEVIKDGQLERRIGGDETLTSIVLKRWLEWEAGPDFYILFKRDPYPFNPHDGRPFAEDIKVAEPGSKTFKSAQMKIEGGTKVVQYSKKLKRQYEWIVDEMLWFVGAETERNAPYPNSLTFLITTGLAKTKFNKKTKFPGFCVSFKDEIQLYQWLNSITICKQEYLSHPLIQIE